MSEPSRASAEQQARAARTAARVLQGLSTEQRVKILHAIADALIEHTQVILQENAKDLKAAEETKLAGPLLSRLKLSAEKLKTLSSGIHAIANDEEPIGKVIKRTQVSQELTLQQETVPIGVLLIIFESRPDALPQIAALSIRSGNGLLLKGGAEAQHSNAILHQIIVSTVHSASNSVVPTDVIGLIQSRQEVSALLELDHLIDLVIPRGGNALVSYIKKHTRIPVLGHADGVCHVYIDAAADLAKALRIVLDSKLDYPAACNAAETLLLHQSLLADGKAQQIVDALKKANVTLYGSGASCDLFQLPAAESLHTEYSALSMAVVIVKDVQEAIDHIHAYGSSHTESIVTEDAATAQRFLNGVDSACVFHNASTRFADGFRFGLGAEVGISTSKIHARGPVGVEGLTTTKWKMVSSDAAGSTVGDFSKGERTYVHAKLPI